MIQDDITYIITQPVALSDLEVRSILQELLIHLDLRAIRVHHGYGRGSQIQIERQPS